MNNTIQLYADKEKKVKAYPITSPDRVVDENGDSIKKQLRNNVKFAVVSEGDDVPEIDGKYDDTELRDKIKKIDTEISDARNGEEKLGKTIKKINENLDKKAKHSDLKIIESRMDNFTKLEEGSTTGDAELQDGRIGADNITYETIGESIRNQFSVLNNSLLNRTKNLINPNSIKVGYAFRTETTQFYKASGWVACDYIADVKQNTSYQFSCNNGSQKTIKALSINEDKTETTILDIKGGRFATIESTKYIVLATNNVTTVANWETWMLIEGDETPEYIPYVVPKYMDIISQETGNNVDKVMSQKVVTELFNDVKNADKKQSLYNPLFIPKKVRHFLHRGLSYTTEAYTPENSAPENSIPAFENGAIAGADGLECDVWETSDGYFMVCHDNSLTRTTNMTGNITDLTREEVLRATIDFGANISKYNNLKVPKLEEYLDICSRYGVIPMIEIKGIRNYQGLIDILSTYGVLDKCIIICTQNGSMTSIRNITNKPILLAISQMDSGYSTMVDMYKNTENIGLFWKRSDLITPDLIKKVHDNDMVLGAFTLNYRSQLKTISYCIDFIVSDIYPLRP